MQALQTEPKTNIHDFKFNQAGMISDARMQSTLFMKVSTGQPTSSFVGAVICNTTLLVSWHQCIPPRCSAHSHAGEKAHRTHHTDTDPLGERSAIYYNPH